MELSEIMDSSSKDQEMFDAAPIDVADEVEGWAKCAATPVQPGETVKAQINRAAVNLGLDREERDRRSVRAAWYGEAGSWSARKYVDFKYRYERWKAKQERKADLQIATARAYRAHLESVARHGSDPDFLEEHLRIPEPSSREKGS